MVEANSHNASAYTEQLRGHAAMVLFAFLISGSFSFGSRAAPHIDPSALTALRFAIAATVLATVVLIVFRRRRTTASDAQPVFIRLTNSPWRFGVLGALYGVYFVCMFEALRLSPPAPLSAVFTLTPIMTAGFAYWFAGQRASIGLLTTLTIGAVGAVWVIFDGSLADIIALNLGPGEAIFFLGAVAHAAYAALVKRFQRSDPLLVFVLGVVCGALICVSVFGARAVVATNWATLPFIVWFVVIYLAIGATIISASLIQFSAQRLPASKVMAYTYLPPALVILIEGASGRGWPPVDVLPGVALILLTLVLLLRPDKREATS